MFCECCNPKLFDFADAALKFASEEADLNVFFPPNCRNLQKIAGVAKVLEIVPLSLQQSFLWEGII